MSGASLSLLASYDDFIRHEKVLLEGAEQEFIRFALSQEECRLQWKSAVTECLRLQEALTKSQRELTNSEDKLQIARRLLDQEKKKCRRVEMENQCLEKQIAMIRDLLMPQQSKLNDETKEKLAFLNSTLRGGKSSLGHHDEDRLKTITELETTGSILSDLSFSRSEDDLDTSYLRSGKRWKARPSLDDDSRSAKRRRSSHSSGSRRKVEVKSGDHVIATTTVRVSREGPITATSKIEAEQEKMRAPPPPVPKRKPEPSAPPMSDSSTSEDWVPNGQQTGLSGGLAPEIGIAFDAVKKINSRQHVFAEKTVIKSENCGPCGKRIKFGKIAMKCRDCKVVSHPDCKEQVPLPCVPSGNTPTLKKGVMGSIADYTPLSLPMVPSIVIHCVNEIESRGLHEVGIYRIPGSDKDVKALKEKFLIGKGAPSLSGYDIHVVCGALKDFLRSLREPLITHGLWHDFARASEAVDPGDCVASLYQAVSELPQPNRDTLAYLILHLQKVASCPDCKMPLSNLAKIFGPTITGYSTTEISATAMLMETKKQQMIVEALMKIPSDYWNSFVKVDSETKLFTPQSRGLWSTPSTESLRTPSKARDNHIGSSRRKFFTGQNTPTNRWRGKKFFETPT